MHSSFLDALKIADPEDSIGNCRKQRMSDA